MRFRILLATIMLLAWCAAEPLLPQASAQTAPTKGEHTEQVLPFDPPIGRVLRLRVTETKYNKGKALPPYPIAVVHELRFERGSAGFILHWRLEKATLPVQFSDPATAALLAPTVAPYLGEPIAIELDEMGTPIRVQDWDKLRPLMIKSVAGILALAPDRQAAKSAGAAVAAQLSQLSAEDAPQLLLRNLMPVLGWGDTLLDVGEPTVGEIELPLPLLANPVPATITQTVSSIDEETVTILSKMDVDPKAIVAVMTDLSSRFSASMDLAKVEAESKALADAAKMAMHDEARFVFDLKTGLPVRFENRRFLATDPEPAITTLVEWLR